MFLHSVSVIFNIALGGHEVAGWLYDFRETSLQFFFLDRIVFAQDEKVN